ncbi:MAG: hypothetical protein Q4D85_08125 [Corynebacterium sp.]|uniref:hypothetical protein n=1 Tax=Corynebacterium sp. TaxID=1720 RepID=UPI0026DB1609|nr:hypothetical protein [Corynebacterium sp.]MDO5098713.1 hypothetical protein [Corynebacterium sp.]
MPRIRFIAAALSTALLITTTQPAHAYGRLFNPTVEVDNTTNICVFHLPDSKIDALGERLVSDAQKVIAATIATDTLSDAELKANAELATSGTPAVLDWARTNLPHREPDEIAHGLRALYNYSNSDLTDIDYYYDFLGIKHPGNQKLKFTKAEAKQAQSEFQTALAFVNAELAAVPPTNPAHPLIAHENTVQNELFRSLLTAIDNCIKGRSTVPKANTPSSDTSAGTSAAPRAGIIAGIITAVTAVIAAIVTFLPQIQQLFSPRGR